MRVSPDTLLFYLLSVLWLPLILLLLGRSFAKNPPQRINPVFGYRTTRSTKSRDAWVFANQLWGKITARVALVLLPASLILQVVFAFVSQSACDTAMIILVVVQLAVLLFTILPVERALRRNFDKDGKPRT